MQFETEEGAKTVHGLGKNDDIWNTAFEGLKLYEPVYGIVIHGIPISDINTINMADPQLTKHLETENNMQPGTIKKITPL